MTDDDGTIEQRWDRNAGSWASAVRSGAMESRRLVTDAAIVDAVLSSAAGRVLDVGCGEGWLARRLAAAGREVTGFDGSRELIRKAEGSGGAQFMVLSYDEFAREPQRVGNDFAVAVCNFSLLGEDIAQVLQALRRVAAPSGHLLIQTVHPLSVGDGARYEDGWREETFRNLPGEWAPMPWYFRTIGSWVRELRSAGWRIHDCIEPLHPATGIPASLILDGAVGDVAADR